MPISNDAYSLFPANKKHSEFVFYGLKYSMTQAPLRRWLFNAGIIRNITFHSFRHTYATLQLSNDTDIYTIQKMLGHKNINTTQIYTKVIDKKKKETIGKINLSKNTKRK
jgi:Site-specific recombinase XerD